MKKNNYEKELVKRLRVYFNLTEDMTSDVSLLNATEGSLGRAKVEFHMHTEQLLVELQKPVKQVVTKWKNMIK